MIAVQGPRALSIEQQVIGRRFACMKYYSWPNTVAERSERVVSRTGYTGEDGIELMVRSTAADEYGRN